MKFFFLLLYIAASMPVFSQDASSSLPLAIEDPRMDAYLGSRSPATLTIKLLNAPADLGTVPVKGSFVQFGSDFQTAKHYQIDTDRELTIRLEQNLPYQQIWLHVGKYLYAGIYVNTDLTVSIDLGQVKSAAYMIGDGIRYSGTDGELNKVMNEHVLFRRDERHALSRDVDSLIKMMHELPDTVFLAQVDSIIRQIDKINAEFIEKHPRYGWAVTNEKKSEFYGRMCVAYWGDKLPEKLAKEIHKHKPFFTSNEGALFYNYLAIYITSRKDNSQPRVHDALLANYPTYNDARKKLLDTISRFEKLSTDERKAKKEAVSILYKKRNAVFFDDILKINIQHRIAIIDSTFHQPKADILKLNLLKMGKDAFNATYPLLHSSVQTNWCKSVIEKELNESLATQKQVNALLASGNTLDNPEAAFGRPVTSLPFGASLYRLDTLDDADDFILALQSRFKDKALIIDFWATWCGPCIAAMPYSKKLYEENKDLPVAYIYLCTNSSSNETLWKNKVAELEIPGTHIFVEDKIIAELKSKFDAESGFPAYVLFDNRGKIHPKRINSITEVNRDVLKTIAGL